MKNLKFIYRSLLILPLVFMVGCITGDNVEDVQTVGTTAQDNAVFIETDDTHEIERVVNLFASQAVEVGVNNPVDGSDTVVSFSVTKDGAPATEGVDYMMNDAVISGGSSFGSSSVSFMSFGKYAVSISSNSGGLTVTNNRLLYNAPELPTTPANITITWDDAFFDYDLFLVEGNQDFDGNVYGYSGGVSNSELIQEVILWGESTIYIQDFWGDNAGTPVELTFEFNGESSTYDVVMDVSKWVLLINASLDENGDPVYELTEL